jgi:multiple sugar transport system ATP-binding protein
MNLLPGTLKGRTLTMPFATFELPDDVASLLPSGQEERSVIAGIRPEHFEDATLVAEKDRASGATFRSRVDVIEWMGSELYAYLPYQADSAMAGHLEALAADLDMEQLSGDESQLVTRLDAQSRVSAAGEAEIWFDLRRLHLFDPETGQALARRTTAPEPAAG